MQFPDYFLKRPVIQDEYLADFERLYTALVEQGSTNECDYNLAAPKWQFLCYLCDQKNTLLHGSAHPTILEFEPRQSNDVDEFGNRCAVYAASDGIWPIYFAIVNRDCVTSLLNGCFSGPSEHGSVTGHYYYFSVDQDELPRYPWRSGMIYLLPRDTFEQQPTQQYNGLDIEIPQWASPVAVKPFAKLAVTPDDFPFLNHVNGHDPKRLAERSARDPFGFPWRE